MICFLTIDNLMQFHYLRKLSKLQQAMHTHCFYQKMYQPVTAELENGRVYSCGLGNSGELGQGGSNLESWLPQPVVESSTEIVVTIASGGNHSSAITDNGFLLTWGCGRHGKLCQGEENFASRFNPTIVRRLRHIAVVLVGCGGCHTMVLGYKRDGAEGAMEDENDDETEHTSNLARVRRRMAEGVLPPLKSSGLPAVKHLVLPTVPDTETVPEKFAEQGHHEDNPLPLQVKVNEDCVYNDISADASESQSGEKEEEEEEEEEESDQEENPKEIPEEEPEQQNQSVKKGNRLTRLFGVLGRKKSSRAIKDPDDADVEAPTVPVSPESVKETSEENSDLGSVSNGDKKETEKTVTHVEEIIEAQPSESRVSSGSVSKSSHKQSKACVII